MGIKIFTSLQVDLFFKPQFGPEKNRGAEFLSQRTSRGFGGPKRCFLERWMQVLGSMQSEVF